MAKIFFSYSHKDETLRNELEVHLSVLKRQGLIETWHDRCIGVGQEFAGIIDDNLRDAEIILLLVSPYFLDSDYCYDIEMREALLRHEQGKAKVLPVILDPCDWKNTPFAKLLALPADGKPITKYANTHDAFMEVVDAIRTAVSDFSDSNDISSDSEITLPGTPYSPFVPEVPSPRTSNLRVRKRFSQHEKDGFLVDSFEYILRFFEASLKELESRNYGISTRFRRIDANTFNAFIYEDGDAVAECAICLADRSSFGSEITYSHSAGSGKNSFNESISLNEGGYKLSLSPMGMASFGMGTANNELTQQGASEYYWAMLIKPLQ